MRFLSFILLVLMLSCKSATSTASFSKIDINSISKEEKQKVYEYGKKAIENCLSKNPGGPESRKSVKQAEVPLDTNASNCDLIKKSGKFADMDLIEIIEDTNDKGFVGKIYRYKARFQKKEFVNEIRIWLRKDGKFNGVIWQEWKDEYVPYQK